MGVPNAITLAMKLRESFKECQGMLQRSRGPMASVDVCCAAVRQQQSDLNAHGNISNALANTHVNYAKPRNKLSTCTAPRGWPAALWCAPQRP